MSTAVPSIGRIRVVLRSDGPTTFKSFPGIAMHAVLHRLLEEHDHEFGYEIHNSARSPLSISPLYELQRQLPIADSVPADTHVCVWVSTLSASLTSVLPDLLNQARTKCRPLSLEWTPFFVEMVNAEPPCFGLPTSVVSYDQMISQSTPATSIVLQFSSPTIFRHGKRDIIRTEAWRALDPWLVFGSHLRKWRAFAGCTPLRLDQEHIIKHIRLVAGHFETSSVNLNKTVEMGFTGWARYVISGDRHVRVAVDALASYAESCGTGARTAYGMGQTHRLA